MTDPEIADLKRLVNEQDKIICRLLEVLICKGIITANQADTIQTGIPYAR